MKIHRYIQHYQLNLVNVFFVAALFLLTACGGANISELPEPDQALLKSSGKKYKSKKIGQFTVHYQADSYTATQLQSIEEELATAKFKALNIVGVADYTEDVHYIFFPTETSFFEHINTVSTYFINPDHKVAYVVHNEQRRAYITHTLFQLVAFHEWGYPKSGFFAIGGAMYADAKCQDYQYPLDEVGSYLARKGNLMSYRAIYMDFPASYEASPLLAEIQAAAFFQFVYDNFGREKMKRLWVKDIRATLGIIGMGELEVATEILGRWRKMAPTQEIDWDKIQKFGC